MPRDSARDKGDKPGFCGILATATGCLISRTLDMARLTIETEENTRKAPSETQWIPILISIVALFASIIQPFHERIIERNNDLLSYRNLACFSVRLIDDRISKLQIGLPDDKITIRTVSDFLKDVKISGLPDPSLVESFVDINRITAIFREINDDKDFRIADHKQQLYLLQQQARGDLQTIDRYIENKDLPTIGLTGGCSYALRP